MEARLFDRADRGEVLRCRFREDPLDAKLERRPPRGNSKGARTDASTTRLGEHRDSQAGDLLVVEPHVEQAQGDVVRRIGDYERCRSPRSPSLLGTRDEVALPLGRQRLVVQPFPRLGIAGGVRDQGHVAFVRTTEHDHTVAQRCGRLELHRLMVTDSAPRLGRRAGCHRSAVGAAASYLRGPRLARGSPSAARAAVRLDHVGPACGNIT